MVRPALAAPLLAALALALTAEAPSSTPAADAGAADAGAADAGSADGGEAVASGDLPADAVPDDPSVQSEIDEESNDLEAMKEAEAQVGDPQAGAATALFSELARLGDASALGARLRDVSADGCAPQPLLPDLGGAAIDPGLAKVFDIEKAKGEYDIPVEMRPLVAQWIHFFQGPGRKFFVRWLARSTRYMPVMQDILRQEGLPEDSVYLSMIESGFSTYAYSWARASGPWQFIGGTGKRFGLRVDFWVDERRDPIKSTRAAARYLRQLHDQFGDWYLAWAGYNAGAGKIARAIARYHTRDFWALCDSGRVLRPETKNYVPKLIAAALVTKHPRQFGFSDGEVPWEKPLAYEEVRVVDPTDLSVLAKSAGCSLDEVKLLNPELRRWLTPPATPTAPYLLRVPKGDAAAFLANYPKLKPRERLVFQIHTVRRGDTLSQIAARYHSLAEAIMHMNGIRSSRRLRLGSELMIPVASGNTWASAETGTPVPRHARARFIPAPPEQEIPAGAVVTGPIRREVVGGKEQLTYGVRAGDSLWAIGQKFDVTIDELKRWNDLRGRRPRLRVGQELVLYPRATGASAPQVALAAAHPAALHDQVIAREHHKRVVHTLAPGDTLWSLSQRYKVSIDDLKRWNRLSRHAVLRAGATLTVEVADGT